MTTKTARGGALCSTPRNQPTHPRLHSGSEAASTLQSSAVAAIGSVRTLAASLPSSTATSLHRITPKRAIKVVLIGDGSSGKTSLRHRFLHDTFFPSYRATIGADFITRTLPIDPLNPEGEKATLQIWDTAGQERFQSLGSAFYRGADAVVITFDVTKEGAEEGVRGWYRAFMEKAPGPEGEEDRKRFCWVCAANKVDLTEEGEAGVERERVREVLNELVEAPEGQVDSGMDAEQGGARPSGAEEPANPAEVLSRPDPNAAEIEDGAESQQQTPSRGPMTQNGEASPTAGKRNSTADEANGGTMKTVYATPYNTITNMPQLSTSPTAKSDLTSKKQDSTKSNEANGSGSGFLSSWYRSKSKASSKPNGHAKRQSIRSIEVFQPSDSEELESDTDEGPSAGRKNFAFPSRSSSMAKTPPPKSVASASTRRERSRVDSTMSLNAPSVYHTPRSSTIFSTSPTPTPRTNTLGIPSMRSGSNQGSIAASTPYSLNESLPEEERKAAHRVSIASSSTASVATVRPNANNPMLRAPKSINDLFQPASTPPSPPSSPPSPTPKAPSSLSLPISPAPITPLPGEIEQGFTLFYTSAKTGHNVERMFQHIVHRVVASQAYTESLQAEQEGEEGREEREAREAELMRRTIRLASGKNPDRGWGLGCC